LLADRSMVLARALRRAAEDVAAFSVARELAAKATARPSIDEAVELVFRFGYPAFDVAIDPVQIRSELAEFAHLVASPAPPRAVLEIGTARGGTLFVLTSLAADDAVVMSVDLPYGTFGGGYSSRRARIYKRFGRPGQAVHVRRSDSHDERTLESVRQVFGDRPLDLLFVDGDHRLEGVVADLRMYTPLVRSGGVVAVHDIVPGTAEKVGGVPEVWRRLKAVNSTKEIVHDWNQGGYGIGVVTKQTPYGDALPLE
jgi:predicted O-methyltransferase YrrM